MSRWDMAYPENALRGGVRPCFYAEISAKVCKRLLQQGWTGKNSGKFREVWPRPVSEEIVEQLGVPEKKRIQNMIWVSDKIMAWPK